MADADVSEFHAKTTAEVEAKPQGVVKRWLSEIEIYDKSHADWHKEAKRIWDIYEGKESKANSFNILWSNTETLAPAVYNSTPNPDVRRRYRDKDPVGKAAATVIERECSYQLDQYDFDASMHDLVLDVLIAGRGVSWKKYEPSFAPQTAPTAGDANAQVPQEPAAPLERITDETLENEHVQWDKFRHGPGKRWKDVTWVSREHDFTYEMAAEKFGEEVADLLEFSDTEGSVKKADKDETKRIFKTTVIHEIWDRDQRRVLFIAPCYKEQPCLIVEDPLKLRGFYPCPRPVFAVHNSRTLVPTPPYRMYEQQAKELDRVSGRINKIIEALKVRGAYSANLPEVANILGASDTDMVPVANVSEIASSGGLDKAIWLMPLDVLKGALDSLYLARDQIKATIYEISGIGDIMRGVTDPNETKGAQVLKSQWGSLRLQKMQREVQRYVRDLTRLDAEIIAERFSMETLMQSTNVKLPTAQQKQQAQMMAQMAAQMGQQPPPEMMEALEQPSWEEVMQLLHTDALRSCRIDIETDSTVAETVTRDMEGLTEVVTALGGLIAGAVPAVQGGMLTVESVKEVAMVIVRRARLGPAVEDAIDQMKPPAMQAPPPELAQGQQMQQEAQEKEQGVKQQQMELGFQQQGMDLQQREAQLAQKESAFQQQQELQARDAEMQKQRDEMMGVDHGEFAQKAEAVAAQQQQVAEAVVQGLQMVLQGMQTVLVQMQQSTEQTAAVTTALLEAMNKPKKISFERGEQGRITSATATIN